MSEGPRPDEEAPVNVLGVGVSPVDIPTAVDAVRGWIERREPRYVCVTGVHGVIESQFDDDLRRIHNRAGLVVPDGMPLVWICRASGRRRTRRVYGPDLMLAVCAASEREGWKHFLYGGGEGVAELLAERLRERFPRLDIAGLWTPPFRPLTEQEEVQVAEMVADSGADIVWVGISTPKQERWMASHVGKLEAPVFLGVGAAFDFHAGLKPQAPSWMQKAGLEWLFRLLSEPRRLWRRYLRNNPLFIWLLLLQVLGLRRRTIDRSEPSGAA